MRIKIKHKESEVSIEHDYEGMHSDAGYFLVEIIRSTIDKINEK